MKVLVLGGTRFFGIDMVNRLVADGHDVTIATRGTTPDSFGSTVERIVFDHRDEQSIRSAFSGRHYDAVIDKIAYSSNDIRRVAGNIDMDRYIFASTGGVYPAMHAMIAEDEYIPQEHELKWGERDPEHGGFDYDEGKRQAECAAVKLLPEKETVMVRLPVIIGEKDYLRRLLFYVDHVMNEKPIYISNPDARICFMSQQEAGGFFADILRTDIYGAVNASSIGTISPYEFICYTEGLTGKKAVLSEEGDPAPYNGFSSDYSLDLSKAESAGLSFGELGDWIYSLIDFYADRIASGAEL
ncbi:MAG: NAD-dependent epimerase/dehydratase family protein [Ruminococcus sp.]|nr:NAD-dependent epimerase/dehydratase family protein [Ruminococcus sp.]